MIVFFFFFFFFFKQKTAYEIQVCWSSDVCSSDLSDASAWTTLWCGTRDRCVGPCKAIFLLSAVAYSFSFGQRRAGAQSSGTAGAGARGVDSSGRWITPPIPATRGLAGATRFVHPCFP